MIKINLDGAQFFRLEDSQFSNMENQQFFLSIRNSCLKDLRSNYFSRDSKGESVQSHVPEESKSELDHFSMIERPHSNKERENSTTTVFLEKFNI